MPKDLNGDFCPVKIGKREGVGRRRDCVQGCPLVLDGLYNYSAQNTFKSAADFVITAFDLIQVSLLSKIIARKCYISNLYQTRFHLEKS